MWLTGTRVNIDATWTITASVSTFILDQVKQEYKTVNWTTQQKRNTIRIWRRQRTMSVYVYHGTQVRINYLLAIILIHPKLKWKFLRLLMHLPLSQCFLCWKIISMTPPQHYYYLFIHHLFLYAVKTFSYLYFHAITYYLTLSFIFLFIFFALIFMTLFTALKSNEDWGDSLGLAKIFRRIMIPHHIFIFWANDLPLF